MSFVCVTCVSRCQRCFIGTKTQQKTFPLHDTHFTCPSVPMCHTQCYLFLPSHVSHVIFHLSFSTSLTHFSFIPPSLGMTQCYSCSSVPMYDTVLQLSLSPQCYSCPSVPQVWDMVLQLSLNPLIWHSVTIVPQSPDMIQCYSCPSVPRFDTLLPLSFCPPCVTQCYGCPSVARFDTWFTRLSLSRGLACFTCPFVPRFDTWCFISPHPQMWQAVLHLSPIPCALLFLNCHSVSKCNTWFTHVPLSPDMNCHVLSVPRCGTWCFRGWAREDAAWASGAACSQA